MEKVRKFKIVKWIMMSFAILSNAFLIFYSCLDDKTTIKWNNIFTNAFANIVNTAKPVEVKTVPLESINIKLSSKETYPYNFIPGYELSEIPLGSAKQIECAFSPNDATNKALSYSCNPSGMVEFERNGTNVYAVGMKTGDCEITAKSSDGNFESTVSVKVIEAIAPTTFSVSLENTNIAIGTTETLEIDIDGGVLGHNELINFRYFDTRELIYNSLNPSIATVDTNGVIRPVSIGSTTISVSNETITKNVEVNVVEGPVPSSYSNLYISGSGVCYEKDMILDQTSHSDHYQLTPYDGEKELNPLDFIWESSDELLVKVDKYGIVRGFRKTSNDDQNATIIATSKITGQTAEFNIVVKKQLPQNMYFYFIVDGNKVWSPLEYTLSTGNTYVLYFSFSPSTQINDVLVECSNAEVLEITNSGNVVIKALKEGNCDVKFTSVANPKLKHETHFSVIKAGVIDSQNIYKVGTTLRKSLGHAAVFMVAQIFTFLTLYMFLFDKKWWLYSSVSLGEGLFICVLSETIQHFVPSRSGSVLDVLIDFAGVVIGFALAYIGVILINKIKKNKNKN